MQLNTFTHIYLISGSINILFCIFILHLSVETFSEKAVTKSADSQALNPETKSIENPYKSLNVLHC